MLSIWILKIIIDTSVAHREGVMGGGGLHTRIKIVITVYFFTITENPPQRTLSLLTVDPGAFTNPELVGSTLPTPNISLLKIVYPSHHHLVKNLYTPLIYVIILKFKYSNTYDLLYLTKASQMRNLLSDMS